MNAHLILYAAEAITICVTAYATATHRIRLHVGAELIAALIAGGLAIASIEPAKPTPPDATFILCQTQKTPTA